MKAAGPRGGKHKGPLRKIVAVIRPNYAGMYGHDWVRLECGHEGRAYGGVKARCRECGKETRPAPGEEGR